MLYYHERYPDNLSAIHMYIVEFDCDLPKGVYAFLESYCCNLECECKKVTIEITKQSAMGLGYFETSDKPIATLQYEWANAARQAFVDYVEVAKNIKNAV